MPEDEPAALHQRLLDMADFRKVRFGTFANEGWYVHSCWGIVHHSTERDVMDPSSLTTCAVCSAQQFWQTLGEHRDLGSITSQRPNHQMVPTKARAPQKKNNASVLTQRGLMFVFFLEECRRRRLESCRTQRISPFSSQVSESKGSVLTKTGDVKRFDT